VLVPSQESKGEHGIELALVDLDWCRPVEVLEGHIVLEARLEHTSLHGDLVPALDLIGEEQRQEGSVVELLAPSEGEPLGQGGRQLAESQALHQSEQVGIDGHMSTSTDGGLGWR
jgi:hypothetical protein